MSKSENIKKNQFERSQGNFLRDDHSKKNLAQEHKDYLGMDIPDNFFLESKINILNQLPMENEKNRGVMGIRKRIAYSIAAALLVLIAATFWYRFSISERQVEPHEIEVVHILNDTDLEADFLVTSLFVDEAELNQFVDRYLLRQVVEKAELSEQQLENLFINSLLIEDSLVNQYLEENLIEEIVL